MKKTRLAVAATMLAISAAMVPAVALGGARTAAHHVVVLKDIRFHPGDLTINPGDSVTWEWQDGSIAHNVTFNGFHSRTMSSGSYTVRFMHRGTYDYRCTIHVSEGMRGEIIVR
jgi:plastocyanin